MQPETNVKFDEKSFKRIKETIQLKRTAEKMKKVDPVYAAPIPHEIGLQITRRCNLRCKTCFLWNDDGLYHEDVLSKEDKEVEIAPSIIEKILYETKEVQSKFFMWGTEPLFHRQWRDIALLLEKDPRWTVVCTNGILIDKELESLLRISENLAIVVSLDGFEEEHDFIRGKGRFSKTMENVGTLLELQKKEQYHGVISLHCVINDKIAPRMYELMEYAEDLGVDSLYLGFPWYISARSAREMDDFCTAHLPWLDFLGRYKRASWHHYSYRMDPAMITTVKEQVHKLNNRVWNIRVRLQPALEEHEMDGYFLGENVVAQNRKRCLALSNRMDVLADGSVTTCQPFPEFTVGNLYHQSVSEVWHGEKSKKVREVVNNGLMPICSKCILLYLNGN